MYSFLPFKKNDVPTRLGPSVQHIPPNTGASTQPPIGWPINPWSPNKSLFGFSIHHILREILAVFGGEFMECPKNCWIKNRNQKRQTNTEATKGKYIPLGWGWKSENNDNLVHEVHATSTVQLNLWPTSRTEHWELLVHAGYRCADKQQVRWLGSAQQTQRMFSWVLASLDLVWDQTYPF